MIIYYERYVVIQAGVKAEDGNEVNHTYLIF
jgi:hypothetical protein